MVDIEYRKMLARTLLSEGIEPEDEQDEPAVGVDRAGLLADLELPFPDGFAPVPRPLAAAPNPNDPLPAADVVVITWTVAEQNALCDVMSPGFDRRSWYRYRHRFDEHYAPLIREGAPAYKSRRLGSWFSSTVGSQRVLLFKSELHLNQDGVSTGDGTATLPVKDLFEQIIAEVQPRVVITTGTAGATFLDHDLGDVIVTRAAKFRLDDEFRNEPFNGKIYRSEWEVPTSRFEAAEGLMKHHEGRLKEPGFAPPTKRFEFDGGLLEPRANEPSIILDGRDIPEFHPILTTDFFEFGTSDNELEQEGGAVEMGDAVLGMVCESLPDAPRWVVVRNVSDPQINADLPRKPRNLDMQAHWAVWYYEKFGYWTSVMSALTSWAIVAGLEDEG